MKNKNKSLLKELKPRDLIISTKHEYNDYYLEDQVWIAGLNKSRPTLIVKIFKDKYFLVTFATTKYKLDKSGKKIVRKGDFSLPFKNKNYYFNLTDCYIFNKEILYKSATAYIGNIKDAGWQQTLWNRVCQTLKRAKPKQFRLIIIIIDAILAEDFELADQLIDQQFTKPTKEDIAKRQEYRNKRREYLKRKKKS